MYVRCTSYLHPASNSHKYYQSTDWRVHLFYICLPNMVSHFVSWFLGRHYMCFWDRLICHPKFIHFTVNLTTIAIFLSKFNAIDSNDVINRKEKRTKDWNFHYNFAVEVISIIIMFSIQHTHKRCIFHAFLHSITMIFLFDKTIFVITIVYAKENVGHRYHFRFLVTKGSISHFFF